MLYKRYLVWNICAVSVCSVTLLVVSILYHSTRSALYVTMCDDLLLIKFIKFLSTSNKVGIIFNWCGSEFYFPTISEKHCLHLQGRIVNQAGYQQKQAAFIGFLLTIHLSPEGGDMFFWNVGLFLNYTLEQSRGSS